MDPFKDKSRRTTEAIELWSCSKPENERVLTEWGNNRKSE